MSATERNPGTGLPCPVCKVDLLMSNRQGIEIDYCPQCRGIWLDRGELDKIIERSLSEEARQAPAAAPQSREQRGYDDNSMGYGGGHDSHGGHGGHGNRGRGHGGRRESFLGRLFD